MNALRNLEAMLLREHESRMCSTRGSALPKGEHGAADLDTRIEKETARDELTRRILALAKANPELSAWAIAKRVESSHPTVLRELRKAGLR